MILKHLPMEEARQAILNKIKPVESKTLPSLEAVGHILGEDVFAPHDLPPYRQTAMDGFAISFKEKQGQGKRFLIKEMLDAGRLPEFNLEPGEATGVLTGGQIPQGTEAVIPQESVSINGGYIIVEQFPASSNIRSQGEDFQSGSVIARKGTRITPGLVAILTAFGLCQIKAIPYPKVAILSLGKEIVPYDQDPALGQIRDSNGPFLSSLVSLQGGLPSIAVSQSSPGKALHSLVQQADLVVTIGGTAEGCNDQVSDLLENTGAEPIFQGYQVKPGSHTSALIQNGKPVIMLSGNPMACFIGYYLLAYPVLRALQGQNPELQRFPALATSPYPKQGGPRRFLLGYALCGHQGWRVAILPAQKSSMRRSLADCNCLIDLPAGHQPVTPESEVFIIPILD